MKPLPRNVISHKKGAKRRKKDGMQKDANECTRMQWVPNSCTVLQRISGMQMVAYGHTRMQKDAKGANRCCMRCLPLCVRDRATMLLSSAFPCATAVSTAFLRVVAVPDTPNQAEGRCFNALLMT
jgi:hypothetical protein